MSISFSLAAAVFNILAGPWIMGIFVGSGEAEVIEYGRLYLVVNGIFYAVMAAMFVYRNALQGLGQATIPMAYTFYSMQRGFHQRLRAGREL